MTSRTLKVATWVGTLAATATLGVAPALAHGPQNLNAGMTAPIAPPAAPAVNVPPNLPFLRPGTPVGQLHVAAPAAHSLTSAGDGFSWSAAAIGALIAAAAYAVAITFVVAVARRREPSAA